MYGNCAGIGYFAAGMLLKKINVATRNNKYYCYILAGGGAAIMFLLTYYVFESHSILWNVGRLLTVVFLAFLSLKVPMIKIKNGLCLWLRNTSEWIYLTHLVFLFVFDQLVSLGNFEMTSLIFFIEISLALLLYDSLSQKRGIFQILL